MKKSFFYSVSSFFGFLCIVFIPFPFYLFKEQLSITEFIFGDLVGLVSKDIFGKPLQNTHVFSDSISMYVLVLILFVLSILAAVFLLRSKSWNIYKERILQFIYLLVCYYLALQLIKYGFDKVFKTQFYLPEPNTLYTPMGKVSPDLLYWSSMGTSHSYNVFLGTIEVIAAILLLIKRTRLVGLLLSFFIMMNVVAVNMAFDISVKVFSLLLLFFTLFLLAPFFTRLYQFFLSGRSSETVNATGKSLLFANRHLSIALKCFVVAIIFLEGLYPYIRSGNFNGDLGKRSYMHGAYEVKQFIKGSDTLVPANFPVKRFFIHKDNYLIFQDQEDEMADYKLVYDNGSKNYTLVDYQMRRLSLQIDYNQADSIMRIQYSRAGQLIQVTGRALDWRELPLLKKEFHWTVD